MRQSSEVRVYAPIIEFSKAEVQRELSQWFSSTVADKFDGAGVFLVTGVFL